MCVSRLTSATHLSCSCCTCSPSRRAWAGHRLVKAAYGNGVPGRGAPGDGEAGPAAAPMRTARRSGQARSAACSQRLPPSCHARRLHTPLWKRASAHPAQRRTSWWRPWPAGAPGCAAALPWLPCRRPHGAVLGPRRPDGAVLGPIQDGARRQAVTRGGRSRGGRSPPPSHFQSRRMSGRAACPWSAGAETGVPPLPARAQLPQFTFDRARRMLWCASSCSIATIFTILSTMACSAQAAGCARARDCGGARWLRVRMYACLCEAQRAPRRWCCRPGPAALPHLPATPPHSRPTPASWLATSRAARCRLCLG